MCVYGAANVARAEQLLRCGEGPAACVAVEGPGKAVGLLWVVDGVEGTGSTSTMSQPPRPDHH